MKRGACLNKMDLIMIFVLTLVEILSAGSALGALVDVNNLFSPTYNEGDALSVNSQTQLVTIDYPYSEGGKGEAILIWRYPDYNDGSKREGRDLGGARRLTFDARGENGGEVVRFAVGAFSQDTDFIKETRNTSDGSLQEKITLSRNWMNYQIDLSGKKLSSIGAGFACTLFRNGSKEPIRIYLRNMYYDI